jgi:hypothetical protein
MTAEKMCACGKPLHYTTPHIQELVERLVADSGECVKVTVLGRTFLVPRHFIALHSLKGSDLPKLAVQYGFEEVR